MSNACTILTFTTFFGLHLSRPPSLVAPATSPTSRIAHTALLAARGQLRRAIPQGPRCAMNASLMTSEIRQGSKWKLVNQKLTPELWNKRSIEIRFISGRGGKKSTLSDFLSVYDLPLSQVNFVADTCEIVSAHELQPGKQYQVVITTDQVGEIFYTRRAYDCLSCGDPLIAVRRTLQRCAECFEKQLCVQCLVTLRKDWVDYLRSQDMLTRAKAGQKVCMSCIMSLPDSLSPAGDENHPLYWRLRIAIARIVEVD